MSQKALDVEEQYRAGIVKLSLCSPRLGKLPAGCTFSVSIELKEDYPPEENGDVSVNEGKGYMHTSDCPVLRHVLKLYTCGYREMLTKVMFFFFFQN